jgi:hypothetical protein
VSGQLHVPPTLFPVRYPLYFWNTRLSWSHSMPGCEGQEKTPCALRKSSPRCRRRCQLLYRMGYICFLGKGGTKYYKQTFTNMRNVLKQYEFWPVNTDPAIKTFYLSINSHLQLGPLFSKQWLPCFGWKGLRVGKVGRGVAPAGISKTSYYE